MHNVLCAERYCNFFGLEILKFFNAVNQKITYSVMQCLPVVLSNDANH